MSKQTRYPKIRTPRFWPIYPIHFSERELALLEARHEDEKRFRAYYEGSFNLPREVLEAERSTKNEAQVQRELWYDKRAFTL